MFLIEKKTKDHVYLATKDLYIQRILSFIKQDFSLYFHLLHLYIKQSSIIHHIQIITQITDDLNEIIQHNHDSNHFITLLSMLITSTTLDDLYLKNDQYVECLQMFIKQIMLKNYQILLSYCLLHINLLTSKQYKQYEALEPQEQQQDEALVGLHQQQQADKEEADEEEADEEEAEQQGQIIYNFILHFIRLYHWYFTTLMTSKEEEEQQEEEQQEEEQQEEQQIEIFNMVQQFMKNIKHNELKYTKLQFYILKYLIPNFKIACRYFDDLYTEQMLITTYLHFITTYSLLKHNPKTDGYHIELCIIYLKYIDLLLQYKPLLYMICYQSLHIVKFILSEISLEYLCQDGKIDITTRYHTLHSSYYNYNNIDDESDLELILIDSIKQQNLKEKKKFGGKTKQKQKKKKKKKKIHFN